MTSKRIFVTGASGCIGHYIAEALIQDTDHELFLLVRNPDKLRVDVLARPGIKVIQGDLLEIEQYADLLRTMDTAILIATSWGGVQEVQDVNITKTLALVGMLDADGLRPTGGHRCTQIIYFSTASILNRQNQPLPEAGTIGTDYVRSKYLAHEALMQTPAAGRITTIFPTLVFGGNERFPASHLSGGLGEVAKWFKLARFFRADGSFHFVHARDIAQVVQHLVDHPPEPGARRELVLGNDRLTVNQMVEQFCAYLGLTIYFRVPLYLWLANIFIVLFRIQMAEWDRFSIDYRHFTHTTVVNPATYGLKPYCPTLADVLRVTGIPGGKGR
jgi:nucleoside-diphosphate-sugar epimerase